MTSNKGIKVLKSVSGEFSEILTHDALQFVAKLHREFNGTRLALLKKRKIRHTYITSGSLPDFLNETESVRTGNWTIAPIPNDLQDRRAGIS